MKMLLIDAHNDTAYRMFFEKASLGKNHLHIDLEKQKSFHTLLLSAVFMDPDKQKNFASPMDYFYQIYNYLAKELASCYPLVMPVTNDLDKFLVSSCRGVIFTLEGGGIIDSTERIDELYRLGIRMVTLTWNDSNAIADSQASGTNRGLTPFGTEAVRYLEKSGILIDLSHASDQTFFDVLECAEKPVAVSHSNSRAICNHPRNITDEMFFRLMENGGVLGINFYPEFLGKGKDISAIFSHLEHFLSLGGENHIGFGSDFDGVEYLPEGIADFSGFELILNEMEKRNWSRTLIEKIFSGNFLRLLRTVF